MSHPRSSETSPETPAPLETGVTNDDGARRRRQMLIKPGIQLRLGGIFAGLSMLCLLIQFLLFTSLLSNAASKMPVGGDYLLDLIPSLLYRSLAFSALIALPLTLLVGVYSTFGITGPIYRFESYLREVIQGRQLGPCKIRKGDALGELCGLINEATEPVRRRQTAASSEQKKEGEAA